MRKTAGSWEMQLSSLVNANSLRKSYSLNARLFCETEKSHLIFIFNLRLFYSPFLSYRPLRLLSTV
jgi:hypothetical protein